MSENDISMRNEKRNRIIVSEGFVNGVYRRDFEIPAGMPLFVTTEAERRAFDARIARERSHVE